MTTVPSIISYIKRNKIILSEFLTILLDFFVHRFYSFFSWRQISTYIMLDVLLLDLWKNVRSDSAKRKKLNLFRKMRYWHYLGIQVTAIIKLENRGKNWNNKKDCFLSSFLFDYFERFWKCYFWFCERKTFFKRN